MWRRSGSSAGCPARLVPDNLKTGVDRPDLYDPKINRSYAELAAHYGCLVDPARSRKPRDKAQVERPMPYIRDSVLAGPGVHQPWRRCRPRRVRWSRRGGRAAGVPAAGRRRPGRGVRRGRARPRWCRCRLAVRAGGVVAVQGRPGHPRQGRPDACTRCRGSTSARPWMPGPPPPWCSSSLGGDLVKTHVRKPQGKQTDLADYPPEKIAFHMRTPAWCRKKAAEIGPACAGADRRAAGRQRAVPAARRPGRAAPGRQAPARPAGGRLREGRRRG